MLLLLIASRFAGFVAPSNLANVFNDTAPLIILALGQMVVILTRCIDLSVAANLALTGMAVAMINVAMPGLPIPLIIAIAILLGAIMGAINGVLVWKLAIPPIVVTLGTMTIFRGIIFLISDGKWVNSHEMSPAFTGFPRMELLGLPVLSWAAIMTIVLFGIMMARTQFGRSHFRRGRQPPRRVYTGINVGKTQFWAFRRVRRAGWPDRLPLGLALCGGLRRYRRRVSNSKSSRPASSAASPSRGVSGLSAVRCSVRSSLALSKTRFRS